jgi:hypothetical protein
MDQVPSSTGWLKAWALFGALVLACVMILPPVLLWNAQQDVERYQQCAAGKRTDCQRTIVWNLVDFAAQLQLEDGSSTIANLDVYGVNQDTQVSPPIRTSENAPQIVKVEPRGMANANGTYRAAVGDKVTFVATISGTTVNVSGYLIRDGQPVPTKPDINFTKQKDGTWQGNFVVPAGLQGQMEIRATGADPKDRASLYLLVAAN